MKIRVLFIFALLPLTAEAGVFKCTDKATGKTNYQSKPCQSSSSEQPLAIKSDPAKEADAKVKLQKLEEEYQQNQKNQAQPEVAAPGANPL